MKANKYLISLFSTFFLLLISTVGVNYILDPMQIFRKSTFSPYFFFPERYSNAGKIKSENYETVFTGNSMTQGYTSERVQSIMGQKSVLLAMAGSSAHEQSIVIGAALKENKVKNIYWGLDFSAFGFQPDHIEDATFPHWAYQEKSLLSITKNYLLNIDILNNSRQILMELVNLKKKRNPHHQDSHVSHDTHEKAPALDPRFAFEWFNSKTSGHKWQQKYLPLKLDPSLRLNNPLIESFNRNVLTYIKNHPDKNFIFFFSPYVITYIRLYFQDPNSSAMREEIFKDYVIELTKNYPNVRVFDFQESEKIVLDFKNYVDPVHHNDDVYKYIMESFKLGRHEVKHHNSYEVLARVRRLVTTYVPDKEIMN